MTMNFKGFLALFALVGQVLSPLIDAADEVAGATGSQKLAAVTTSFVTIGTQAGMVVSTVENDLPAIKTVIGALADLKHALQDAVRAVEGRTPSATAPAGVTSTTPPGMPRTA